MAKQRKHCEASIARVYAERVRGEEHIVCPPPISLDTTCIHTRRSKPYEDEDPVLSAALNATTNERYTSLMFPDLPIDLNKWRVHKQAKICGIKFTSGESMHGVKRTREKMLRCGSVITLVSAGRSLYAWVSQFLSYFDIHLAHVNWLPVPDYPTGSPIVVRLRNDSPIPRMSCVVDLADIDPSPISILHNDTCMYMMRMKGIDTMPTLRT